MNSDLYDIIKNTNSNILFLYGIGLFITIYIFTNYEFGINLFIGIILYSIIIIYFYVYQDKELLNNESKNVEKEKMVLTDTKSNTNLHDIIELKNYPDITNFLFYLKPYSQFSNVIYIDIVDLLKSFIIICEDCVINHDLISPLYQSLVDIKMKILFKLTSFQLNNDININIDKIKTSIENILNRMMEDLLLKNNKYIYYNGYNIGTKKLDDIILPSNEFDYQNEYIRGTKIFDFQELLI